MNTEHLLRVYAKQVGLVWIPIWLSDDSLE